MAGMPQRSPRLVRRASSRMLVGIQTRMNVRMRVLMFQISRSMTESSQVATP